MNILGTIRLPGRIMVNLRITVNLKIIKPVPKATSSDPKMNSLDKRNQFINIYKLRYPHNNICTSIF